MYLVTIKLRAKSPEAAQEICRQFSHLLELHQEPQFEGGDCSINVNDPCDVRVHERWGNQAALNYWLNSEARRKVFEQAKDLSVGTPEMDEAMVWGR